MKNINNLIYILWRQQNSHPGTASKKLILHVSLNKLALYKLFKYGTSNKLYVDTFLVKVNR